LPKSSKKVVPQEKQKVPIWLWGIIAVGAVLIVMALISSSQAASTTAPQVSGKPVLQVDKEKVDLGDVPLGQTVSVSFELTNTGDQPLQLTKKPYIEVAAGC
jgi:flagellar basal body-associated protein FliL